MIPHHRRQFQQTGAHTCHASPILPDMMRILDAPSLKMLTYLFNSHPFQVPQ